MHRDGTWVSDEKVRGWHESERRIHQIAASAG
jgi:hypothetical protein